VIDLGAVVAAPYAATLLGDFGAEVIKIEPPTVPDAIRSWATVEGKYQPFWLVASRNKFPITLNLKHPIGKKMLTQLVERSEQTPGEIRFPGLPMGSAKEVIYQDLLGYSPEEIQDS
jgi:crotonobetainyl-CoA:carnitine CoA-transferase CaiB-like acyl-CoA transferase